MMEKAQRMANQTYSFTARSCHRITTGKTRWKNVSLHSVLYGAHVTSFTETDIQTLHTTENKCVETNIRSAKISPNLLPAR